MEGAPLRQKKYPELPLYYQDTFLVVQDTYRYLCDSIY